MTAAQVIAALAIPALARSRARDLRPWLVLTLLAQLAGFCALSFALPVPAVAIAIVLGFGLGGAFALCMVLALDHLPDPAQAGALAGFMQGVGFMIAALAPFVTGWVREHTGGFTIAWAYLAVVVAVLLPLMLCFDPRRYASSDGGPAFCVSIWRVEWYRWWSHRLAQMQMCSALCCIRWVLSVTVRDSARRLRSSP